MFTKEMEITPELAREWLETLNKRNRPVSARAVDRFAYRMKHGLWKLNGEPIIFGKSKFLLDGQHRLKACVQSGKSFPSLVIHGVDDTAFDTLDDGNKRTFSDVLAIRGEPNYAVVAAGVRYVWLYATGRITSGDLRTRGNKLSEDTNQILETTLEKHPGLRKSARMYCMLRARVGGLLLPIGMVVGLHYLFSLIDENKADDFFGKFQSGLDLGEGHPIALLRQRIIAGSREASQQIRARALYFYTVTAWNAFAAGARLKRLNLSDAQGEVPEIVGLPKSLMRDLLM